MRFDSDDENVEPNLSSLSPSNQASFFGRFEFLEVNRNLIFAWLVSVLIFAVVFLSGSLNQQFLPGMTEARQHIINFKEPVIIEKILVSSGQLLKKSDPLFILSRPDLDLKSNENATSLSEVVAELNIMKNKKRSLEQWETEIMAVSDKVDSLDSLQLKFLSLINTRNYILKEKASLQVLSPVDGYAGELKFNVGETVAPYTSLLSLFQSQPSIVKSYIPESFDLMQLNDQRSSVIKSMSRDHVGIGKIVSVGTMLSELPARFQKDPMNKLFGREIKIMLSEDNGFFLGEKVFVRFEDK